MLTSVIFILIGLFAIIGSITKPNFYWNNRKAVRMRKILGDTITTWFYIVLGVALIVFGVINMINL